MKYLFNSSTLVYSGQDGSSMLCVCVTPSPLPLVISHLVILFVFPFSRHYLHETRKKTHSFDLRRSSFVITALVTESILALVFACTNLYDHAGEIRDRRGGQSGSERD